MEGRDVWGKPRRGCVSVEGCWGVRTVTRTRAGGAGAWSPRARPRGSRGGTRWAQAWARAIVGAREARIEKRNGARGPRPGSSMRTLAQGERGEGGEPGRTLNSATCSSVRLAAILCVRGCLVFAGVERGRERSWEWGWREKRREPSAQARSLACRQLTHPPSRHTTPMVCPACVLAAITSAVRFALLTITRGGWPRSRPGLGHASVERMREEGIGQFPLAGASPPSPRLLPSSSPRPAPTPRQAGRTRAWATTWGANRRRRAGSWSRKGRAVLGIDEHERTPRC